MIPQSEDSTRLIGLLRIITRILLIILHETILFTLKRLPEIVFVLRRSQYTIMQTTPIMNSSWLLIGSSKQDLL